MANLDSRIPAGPLADKWRKHKAEIRLVNPANKRKYEVIVVGAGLAGSSAASSLADLGYRVKCIVFHDSPRRAHSIAAQGGINAAKNYQNDGDSVRRLFQDTIKGGDYRAREANVYRLAQVSTNIIDQCVAQGVPLVSGAVIRWDGQLTTYDTRNPASPCYACVFPPDDAPEEVSCATMGVLAPLVGVIGSLQAAEALKCLSGTGTSLAGRLQLLDGLSLSWTEMRLKRQTDCPVCANRPALTRG